MSNAPTVDDILTKFLIQTVPEIHGELMYDFIMNIKRDLFSNVAVIPTTLGVRQQDHSGIIMQAVLHKKLSGTPFI